MRPIVILSLLVTLLAACAPTTQPQVNYIDTPGHSGVTGQVFLKKNGEPLSGAYVNIYPSRSPNLLGPSTYISSQTGLNGGYTIDVPPGTYYIVARKRASGQATGPLSPGDYFSEDARQVIKVKDGMLTEVDLPMAYMTAPMFFKRGFGEMATETGIKGILFDAQGKPLAGAFAIAYTNADIKRLPDYASTLTNDQGKFTLYLPEGGAYYLAARLHAWDMPRPGEPYAKYDGDKLQPVIVPDKKFVEGIQMVLKPFSGEYKEGMNQRPF